MPISRDKARIRVEKAIAETRPEFRSSAWDSAWSSIRKLQSRGIGEDTRIAEELAAKMKEASKQPTAD